MQGWRIWAESSPVVVDSWDETADMLLERLADRDGIEGVVGHGAVGSTLGAVFSVDADDVVAASSVAASAFSDVLLALVPEASVEHLEVSPEDYEPLTFVGASDAAKILDVSRQRVYQLMARPDFPEPAAELARGKVWDRREVMAFAKKDRVGGRPKRTTV